MEEGCLSLPEQYAEVERPKEIILEYMDENEKIIKKEQNKKFYQKKKENYFRI